MTHILKTRDYSLFKRIEGNRNKSAAQVRRLTASLKENKELLDATPILVNDKMEVIDGQHRLEARQALGEPIHYFVVPGLGLEHIQKLNSGSKTWTPVDYAISFAEKGNRHYKTYLEFKEKFHLTHEILVSYLAIEKGATINIFREGKFKIENPDLSMKLCRRLCDIQEFHNRGDSKKFAFAVKELLLHADYDHDKMMGKVKQYGDRFFKDAATASDYMRQLEALYNHRSRERAIKIF